MNTEQIIERLLSDGVKVHLVGSKYTCDPIPADPLLNTDYLVFGYGGYSASVSRFLLAEGFYRSDKPEGFRFMRRNGDVFIIAKDRKSYKAFLLATEVARKLNLLDKKDRITLFQAILYGKVA